MIRVMGRVLKPRLGAIATGIFAGAAGTAAMTAHQELRQRLGRANEQPQDPEQPSGDRSEPDRWQSAPAPAQVGKRVIEGFLGRPVPAKAIPVLTQVMHWSYGSAWGGVYAITRKSARGRIRLLGPLFGLGVWAVSYIQLVPLGIYEPPWSYPLSSIADEIGYHLVYGATVATAYNALAQGDGA
jgi:hypothetical protein